MPKVRILSIDGGGIRGIIPARAMMALEEIAGKPIVELFDFVVGTSTGGILGMGAALPGPDGKTPRWTAAEGLDFYLRCGSQIFPQGMYYTMRQMIMARYPASPLKKILAQRFGEARLGDSLVKTLIPSYDTLMSHPKFFKSWENYDKDFYMHDIAYATSAAPTFLKPIKLSSPKRDYMLIDGGVFANNPAMCAVTDARKLFPAYDIDDFIVVSLGAGETEYPFTKQDIRGWGALQWIIGVRILHLFIDGSIDTVNYQLNEFLTDGNYYRVQTPLATALSAMDDSRNIAALLDVAEAMVDAQQAHLEAIVARLLK